MMGMKCDRCDRIGYHLKWCRHWKREESFNPIGFFAGLTNQQQKDALAYEGEENHGDPAFQRKAP